MRIPSVSATFVALISHGSWSSVAYGSLPHGVAAGDVDQTSAVLWARSIHPGPVRFVISGEPEFGDALEVIVEQSDAMLPVKVEVNGLRSGQRYYYRAVDQAGKRDGGTFRTPAEFGTYAGLRFGVSGDWRGELRPYPAISNLADRRLDFFVALGDTIYADIPSIDFPGEQARTLDDFRIKHNEVYSERFGTNSWAEARGSTAIFAVIDDHEVANDFQGGAPASSDARFDESGEFINETELFRNGLQAFHEYNPIREEYFGETGERLTAGKRKLYRFRTFGSDAAIFLLDTRSFRSEALEEIRSPFAIRAIREFLRDSFDEGRTMLGGAQLELLLADLLASHQAGITWKFVMVPEPIQNLGPVLASDRFEGYAYERSIFLQFIDDYAIDNVVFVAADIHGTIVNNLTYQRRPGDRQRPTTAFEITTGAVAYDAPLGATVVSFAPPSLRFLFGDFFGFTSGQADQVIRTYANLYLATLEYSRIGLVGSPVDARLCRGDYVAVNTFGWTEFDIDAASQDLLVTTWGVDWYTQEELEENPARVLERRPRIVSQFLVHPMNPPQQLEGGGSGDMPAVDDAEDGGETQAPDDSEDDVEALACPPPSRPCGALGLLSIQMPVSGLALVRLLKRSC